MSLQIQTLGSFRVVRDGWVISEKEWKTQKNQSLVKILLTFLGQSVSKEQLLEWLWPELGPKAAARNLRVAVSHVRKIVQPGLVSGADSQYLITTPTGYTWKMRSGDELDAQQFEAAARLFIETDHAEIGNLPLDTIESARALYGGTYLLGDRYEDWAASRREELQELYFSLITLLAETYARLGRYQRAIMLCKELLVTDKCRESIWCQLMLYHYHSGDQQQALAAYEQCQSHLMKELNVAPHHSTTELAWQIRRRIVQPVLEYPRPARMERLRSMPISLSQIPFVGRSEEWQRISQTINNARSGHGSFLFIEGQAGIGKTRLCHEALTESSMAEALQLQAYCSEASKMTPYFALSQIARHSIALTEGHNIEPVLSQTSLSILLPELHPNRQDISIAPDQIKQKLFSELYQHLKILSSQNLLIIFIDDLQWADFISLEFLQHFSTEISKLSALVIGTFRTEEVTISKGDSLAGLLFNLKQGKNLETLRLEALAKSDTQTLLESLSGSVGSLPQVCDQIYAKTGGHPLFLISMLQFLFEQDVLRLDEGDNWLAEESFLSKRSLDQIPVTAQRVIERRIEHLNLETRQVLEAASALGRQFDFHILSQIRSWRKDLLLDHLDSLAQKLLIRNIGSETFSFEHDMIREVTYLQIPENQRAWTHSKAASAMRTTYASALGEHASAIADQYQRAEEFDLAVQYWCVGGAYAAQIYANAEALSCYRKALSLIEDLGVVAPDREFEAHERIGDLFQISGQYDEAWPHFEAAKTLAESASDRTRLFYKLAHVVDRKGMIGPPREMLRQAVEEADRAMASGMKHLELARVYGRWAIMGSSWGESHKRWPETEQCIAKALNILEADPRLLNGDKRLDWHQFEVVSSVLINIGEALTYWKQFERAEEVLEQALFVAERQNDIAEVGYVCNNWADAKFGQRKLEEARVLYAKAIEAWSKAGHLWELMAAQLHLGLTYACEGNWDQARKYVEEARVIGERIGPTRLLTDVYQWLALVYDSLKLNRELGNDLRLRAQETAAQDEYTLPDTLQNLSQAVVLAQDGHTKRAEKLFSSVRSSWANSPGVSLFRIWILEQCESAVFRSKK